MGARGGDELMREDGNVGEEGLEERAEGGEAGADNPDAWFDGGPYQGVDGIVFRRDRSVGLDKKKGMDDRTCCIDWTGCRSDEEDDSCDAGGTGTKKVGLVEKGWVSEFVKAHNVPSKKTPQIMIFCLCGICKRQTIGIGRIVMAMSEMVLVTPVPTYAPTKLMHSPRMRPCGRSQL